MPWNRGKTDINVLIHRIDDSLPVIIEKIYSMPILYSRPAIDKGGNGGGFVVAEGTPEQVAKVEGSHTGRFLREVLG